jgi:hypothetical protein
MAGVDGERELEDFLTDVFEGREDEPPEEPAEKPVEQPTEPEPEPEEVPAEPPVEAPPSPPAEEPEEETPPEPEEEEVPALAWAKKKYGDDAQKWAAAAYQMEQHISKLAAEKQKAEEFGRQMAEYAQFAENQMVDRQQAEMPISAQEEAWIEQGLADPVNYAYTALSQGHPQLYNGLIARIAEENPALAANVGTQAQMAMQQAVAAQQIQADQAQARESDFPTRLGESVQRVGVDLQAYGNQMSEKIAELGEYHPYVQTIMHSPDPGQRDLALMAVYDLVRTGKTATRRARETDHEAQIRREGELRREAASVVTGSPHVEQQKESPFMEGMLAEWRRAGQWTDNER